MLIALTPLLRFPQRLAGLVLSCTAADLASFNLRSPLGGTAAQREAFNRLLGGPAQNGTDAALRSNWTQALPLYYNGRQPAERFDLGEIDRRTVYSAGAGFNRGNDIGGL